MGTYKTKSGHLTAYLAGHDGTLMNKALHGQKKADIIKFEEGDWILSFSDGYQATINPEIFSRLFQLIPEKNG